MSIALTIVNNLSCTVVDGSLVTAKQGIAASEFDEGYDLTVTGYPFKQSGGLATATVLKVYDDDEDTPADPLYWHFWANGNLYVQFVGATSSFIVALHAYVPLVLYGNTILAAGNTTDILGGSEPTLEDIDHVNLGNYTGGPVAYAVTLLV